MIIISHPIRKVNLKIPESFFFDKRELRLDYLENPLEFPINNIYQNDIITIRDINEGGENSFDLDKKISFYQKVIKEKKCLVDLEISNFNSEIPAENLILSYHNFSKIYEINDIENCIEKANRYKAKYLKIAVNINKYQQFIELSTIIKKSNKPVILVGMGKLGKLSRLLYNHLGSIGTYIGYENNKTANGQLSVNETKVFNLSGINSNTIIGGLIGGDQVYNSLGIPFYNNIFYQKGYNARYLPFDVDNFQEFWDWIKPSKIKFYGFSITMPHKAELSKRFNLQTQLLARNLFIPNEKTILNTDAIAFEKCIEKLEINFSDNILIVGSGNTAETALFALKKFSNVLICSRNDKNGKALCKRYNRKFVPFKKYTKIADLIINCSSIGMKEEDFAKITNLEINEKIIDLPYTQKISSLINFCIKNNLPHIDGKGFWHLQAEKQLEEFLNEITKQQGEKNEL